MPSDSDPDGLSPELITSSLISPLMPQPGVRGELVHLAASFYGCSFSQAGFAGSALCFSPSPAVKCTGQGERKLRAKPPSPASLSAQESPALLRTGKGLLGTALG